MILASVHARLFGGAPEPMMIGYHKILERIGVGGMGEVYLAHNTELKRLEALKVLRASGERSPADEARLKLEAEALARLSHPNVVQVYHSSVEGGELRLAMEYVRGPTLKSWQDAAPRSWRELLAVYIAAGRGLEAAHRAGLVHRDFKPSNVILGEEASVGGKPGQIAAKQVRVIDFGLAIAGDRAATTPSRAPGATAASGWLDRLTREGDVIGTPFYMSPEQFEGQPLTAKSDQFSFCVTLYQALYGQHPYYEPERATTPSRKSTDNAEPQPATVPFDLAALKRGICGGPLRPPPPGSRLPRRIFRILARGLEHAPADRYPGMHELLATLERELVPSVVLRYALVGLATGLVAAAVTASVVHEGPPKICATVDQQLVGVWDGDRAGAARAAFLATEAPFAAAAFAAIAPDLDAYAEAWKAGFAGACGDPHRSGTPDGVAFQARTRCLDERRTALARTVDAFTRADGDTVLHARESVAALPRISDCENPRILAQACTDIGRREELLGRAPTLRAAVARTAAFERAGDYARAVEAAAAAAEAARSEGLAPWIAETSYTHGRLLLHRRDFGAARLALERAYTTALAADCADLAIDAANRLTKLSGLDDRPGAGIYQDWTPFALGAIGALHEPAGARAAEALHNRGLLHELRLKEYPAAEADDRESLRIREQLSPVPLADTAVTHQNLGAVLFKLGRPVEGRRQLEVALLQATAAYGAGHPELGNYYLNLGKALGADRQLEAAVAQMVQALPLVQRAQGARHRKVGEVHLELAQLYDELGDSARALEHASTAESILLSLGEDHELVFQARRMLSLALDTAARYEDALVLRRWLMDRTPADDPVELAYSHLELAQSLVGLERWAEALEHGLVAERWVAGDESVASAIGGEADVYTGLALLGLERRKDALERLKRAVATIDGNAKQTLIDRELLAHSSFGVARASCSEVPAALRETLAALPDTPRIHALKRAVSEYDPRKCTSNR